MQEKVTNLDDSVSQKNILTTIKNIDQQLSYLKNIYGLKNDPLFAERIQQNQEEEKDLKQEFKKELKKEKQVITEDMQDELTKQKQINLENIQDEIEDVISTIDLSNAVTTKQFHIENSSFDFISDVKDNTSLIISEKKGKVFLPYTVNELHAYLNEYPEEYLSLTDVVNKEYIVPLSRYKYQKSSRFREMYALIRDIEMKSIIEAFKKAVSVMFNSSLNPAIIAACKSEIQFNNYIYCLEHGRLDEFKDFQIIYDYAPFNDTKVRQDFNFSYCDENRNTYQPTKKYGKHY